MNHGDTALIKYAQNFESKLAYICECSKSRNNFSQHYAYISVAIIAAIYL